MDINTIINIKQEAEETIDVHIELHERFKTNKAPQKPLFILTQLVIEGRIEYTKQISGGKSYCHDCSLDSGRRVEHFTNNSFTNFKQQAIVKKYVNQIQELHDLIYI